MRFKFLPNLCGSSVDTMGPMIPVIRIEKKKQKKKEKKKGRASANRRIVWLARPVGLALLTLRTDVAEDHSANWSIDKSAELW